MKKKIKSAIIKTYSGIEEARMFVGALEMMYLNPSHKRLKEIHNYGVSIQTSKYTNWNAKKKAGLLASEARCQNTMKLAHEYFAKMAREGLI